MSVLTCGYIPVWPSASSLEAHPALYYKKFADPWTRWTQSGQVRFLSGHTIIYSCHQAEDAPHTEGMAVFMDKEAHKALISWEPVSPRIITAKFRTSSKNIDLFVVQCYATTKDADDATRQDFYNLLQAVLDRAKQKDILMGDILMGDILMGDILMGDILI